MRKPARLTGNTVLVVGSLHYDIMVEADHLPRKDETAVGSRWFPKFGGKGGNQAVSAQAHGAAARLLGAVGADDFGRFLRARLETSGVDHRFVATCDDVGSGMSVAIVDANGDYAATIVSGANLQIATDTLQNPELWQDVGLLVLQNEVPEAINLAAAKTARAQGIRTLLNAAPSRPLSAEFARLVDVLVVNAVEAEMMGTAAVTSLKAAAKAAKALADRFECVIVTAGSLGLAAWSAEDEHFSIPAEKITAVSAHGAGDAFIGALAACMVAGTTFKKACAAASRAAAEHVAGRPTKVIPR
ncbi:MAG: PfkB family carbohydrate kinase [Cypionkella sp.]|uniref:PfkB family carbohydrate kinase n=1 Tax=Cypionkella sp. TaxID=2811411 RepID=UPI002AB968D6|nr:PfkB family carbohydrate kinase [Cypionkella sp.]MDZ4311558.1 PfkB family carbohydrate kinase [Cypionkella sp.]